MSTESKPNRERVMKLVEALRSGEFEQERKALRQGDKFCCLGVACEVYRRETGQGYWGGDVFVVGNTEKRDYLPSVVSEWFGFSSESCPHNPHIKIPNRGTGSAVAHNDNRFASFEEIAAGFEALVS